MAKLWKLGEWRLCCAVPGCGITMSMVKYPGTIEMLCGKHYRLADKELRQLLTKIERRGERYGWSIGRELHYSKTWGMIRDQVIERAMGL